MTRFQELVICVHNGRWLVQTTKVGGPSQAAFMNEHTYYVSGLWLVRCGSKNIHHYKLLLIHTTLSIPIREEGLKKCGNLVKVILNFFRLGNEWHQKI